MPHHNRHLLARLLAATCLLAALVAAVFVAPIGGRSHPPERIHIAPTSSTSTSSSTTTTTTIATTVTTTTAPPSTSATTTPRVVEPAPVFDTSDQDVLAIIRRWFGDINDQAVHVAHCESRLTPTARAGPNYGLFQINRVHAGQWADVTGTSFDDSWADPELNTQFARWLYDLQGWAPWSCRP